ncbi:MAG: septation protein A [Gammaproteobacteria bacterium]|nr:septation protein A [Gammaproteobacteria bacterium]
MKLFLDFFPIILFFVVFKLYEDHREGILAATVAVIIGSLLQLGYTWWKERRVHRMHLVTLIAVLLLGGLTLLLEDERFIKWKPTAVNVLFGVVFLGSQLFTRQTLVQRALGGELSLPARVWSRLNLACAVFFIALGMLNLYVVYHFDTEVWVNFKLFGQLGLTFAFMMGLGVYLYLGGHLAEQAPTTQATEAENPSSPAASNASPTSDTARGSGRPESDA